ncbi:MAG: hypothetical protein JNK78_12500 [Planctomycetes bacterium]|nr:hypothetical protein [Planctomycetota bacterium]
MRAASTVRVVLLAAAALPLASCIASNVVAEQDRMVVRPVASLEFRPVTALALDGLWESVELTGDVAVSLRRIWYVFSAGGSYTAAALAEVDGAPSFQTLSGTWAMSPEGLSLDGAAPVPVEEADGHVRISASTGRVVLRKGALQ